MIRNAVTFAFGGELDFKDGLRRLVVLSVAYFASVLVVPFFTIYGWFMKSLYAAYRGRDIPKFTDYTELTVLGLKGSVVPLGYVLLFYGISVGVAYGYRQIAGPVTLILAFLSLLVIPPALIEFQKRDDFFEGVKAAYAVRDILSKSVSGDYLIAVLLTIAVALVYAFLGLAFTITIVGALLLPGLLLARNVSFMYCYGVGYRKAESNA